MFKGQVDFLARVLDTERTFTTVHFKPPVVGVESAIVEMQSIEELSGRVCISSVATADDGESLAQSVIESTFNRLAFFYGIVIEPARITGSQFSPLNPPPSQGHHLYPGTGHIRITGHTPRITIGVSSSIIQSELEKFEPTGEMNFGQFRSARLSVGPVEEFMHLYAILLSLFNDSQKKVDAFVVSVEPGVQQTPIPNRPAGKMETIYTRLRNELAHKRQGVTMPATKLEISRRIANLHTIVRLAIAQH